MPRKKASERSKKESTSNFLSSKDPAARKTRADDRKAEAASGDGGADGEISRVHFKGVDAERIGFDEQIMSRHFTSILQTFKTATGGGAGHTTPEEGVDGSLTGGSITKVSVKMVELLCEYLGVQEVSADILRRFKLIDMGCGPPRALLQFACLGFDECLGIELPSNKDCTIGIAETALMLYGKKGGYGYCDIKIAFDDLGSSNSLDDCFPDEGDCPYKVVYSFCDGITVIVKALGKVLEDPKVIMVILASKSDKLRKCAEKLAPQFRMVEKQSASMHVSSKSSTVNIFLRIKEGERGESESVCGCESGSGSDNSNQTVRSSLDFEASGSESSAKDEHDSSQVSESSAKDVHDSAQASFVSSLDFSAESGVEDLHTNSSLDSDCHSAKCSLNLSSDDSAADLTTDSVEPPVPVASPAVEVLPGVYILPKGVTSAEKETLAFFLNKTADYVDRELQQNGKCKGVVDRGIGRLEIDLGFLKGLRRSSARGLRVAGQNPLLNKHPAEAAVVLGCIDSLHQQCREALQHIGAQDPDKWSYYAYALVSEPGSPPQEDHQDRGAQRGLKYITCLVLLSEGAELTQFITKDGYVSFEGLVMFDGQAWHRGPGVGSSRRMVLSLVACIGFDDNHHFSRPFRDRPSDWIVQDNTVSGSAGAPIVIEDQVVVADAVMDLQGAASVMPEEGFREKAVNAIKALTTNFNLQSHEEKLWDVHVFKGQVDVKGKQVLVDVYARHFSGTDLFESHLYRDCVTRFVLGSVRAVNNPVPKSIPVFKNGKHSFGVIGSESVSLVSVEPLKTFLPELIQTVQQDFMKDGHLSSKWHYFTVDLLDAVCCSHSKNVAHLGLCPEVIKRQPGTEKLMLVGWDHSRFLTGVVYKTSVKEGEKTHQRKTGTGLFPAVEAFPKDLTLRAIAQHKGGLVGAPGFVLRRKITDVDTAKHADLWAVAVICLLPFLPGKDLLELQKELRGIEVSEGDFKPTDLLRLIEDSMVRNGATADALRVIQIAADISGEEGLGFTYASENIVNEVRAWHLKNLILLCCDLLNNEVSAEKSFAKPFITNYIADSRELEHALVVEGLPVYGSKELEDLYARAGKGKSRAEIINQKPLVLIQLPGMGINAFTALDIKPGDLAGYYGCVEQAKTQRNFPPGRHRMDFHTLPIAGGNELKGSPGNIDKPGDILFSDMVEVGVVGSFFASSRKDPRKSKAGNVKIQSMKQNVEQLEYKGKLITAMAMFVALKIGRGGMLKWDYDFTNVCGDSPFNEQDIDAMISSYSVDPSDLPHVKEILQRMRILFLNQGYTDSD